MQKWNDEMNEKKKDVKKRRKKRRIKDHPHPHHLRNYEAGHTYGGLKIFFTVLEAEKIICFWQ